MGTPIYPQDITNIINRLTNRTVEAGNRNVVISSGVTLTSAQEITGTKTFKATQIFQSVDADTHAILIMQPDEVNGTNSAEMLQVYYQEEKPFWLNEKGNPRIRRAGREVPLKIFGMSLHNPGNGDGQVDLLQFFKRVAGEDEMCARVGPTGGFFGRRIETDTGPNEFAGITTFLDDIIANTDIAATGNVTAANLAADLTMGARTAITVDSPTPLGRYSANGGTTQYAPTARLVHGDEVKLSGRIEHAGGATTANDVMVSDIGAAFRPAREVNLLVPQQGGAAATMRINTSGQMIMLRTTTTTWTSLDGVSYRKS